MPRIIVIGSYLSKW